MTDGPEGLLHEAGEAIGNAGKRMFRKRNRSCEPVLPPFCARRVKSARAAPSGVKPAMGPDAARDSLALAHGSGIYKLGPVSAGRFRMLLYSCFLQ